MSLILPKGIVVNSPGISGDLERRDGVPLTLTEIAKFWKVYTTTKRRLLDPTAERLENLWWRIWGSRQRNLKGITIARLFTEISDGRTFVPLRGPPNRYEPDVELDAQPRHGSGASSTIILYRQENEDSNHHGSFNASKGTVSLPPPILKKTRGPSTSGPRPTARFISPHASEEEASEDCKSSAQQHSSVTARSPSPELHATKDTQQIGTSKLRTKKSQNVVDSKSARQDRHTLDRQKLQASGCYDSSVNELEVSEDAGSSSGDSKENSQDRKETQSKFREEFSLNLPNGKGKDVKKPVVNHSLQRGAGDDPSFQKSNIQRDTTKQTWAISDNVRLIERNPISPSNSDKLDLETDLHLGVQGAHYAGANPSLTSSKKAKQPSPTNSRAFLVAHKDLRSMSDGDHEEIRDFAAVHHFADSDSKNSTRLLPTYTDATGLLSRTGSAASGSVERNASSELKGLEKSEISPLFAKRSIQPLTKAASALFDKEASGFETLGNRSKSQLSLLLEKDKTNFEQRSKRDGGSFKGKDIE